MTVTFQTGSNAATVDFVTAIVSHTSLVGTGSFSREVTDLMANGYILDETLSDGTNYIAFLHQKYRKSF